MCIHGYIISDFRREDVVVRVKMGQAARCLCRAREFPAVHGAYDDFDNTYNITYSAVYVAVATAKHPARRKPTGATWYQIRTQQRIPGSHITDTR